MGVGQIGLQCTAPSMHFIPTKNIFSSDFGFLLFLPTSGFTACYTAEMDSAPKNHLESIFELLFLKKCLLLLILSSVSIFGLGYKP